MDLSQADVEFRNIGDVDYDAVVAPFLTSKQSPMLASAKATHVAAQPMTALFWAQAEFENQVETTGQIVHPSDHNPVTLRPWVDGNGTPCDPRTNNGLPPGAVGIITAPNGTLYLQFGSDAVCAAEWKYRLTDPSYKNGVYVNAHALKDMLNIYCPPGDKHAITGDDANAAYYPAVMTTLKQFAAANSDTTVTSPPATGGTTVPTTTTIGHVPKPPVRQSWVTGAIGVNREADAQRKGMILGACIHTSDGTYLGNRSVFIDQQYTWVGLTDYQVGGGGDGQYDGVIDEFIDPSKPYVPYANGSWRKGPDAPTQQAIDFVNQFGIDAINQRLRSIEHPDNQQNDFPISDRQLDSSALLVAWILCEEAGQTADMIAWLFGHDDFGVQHSDCPGLRFKRRWTEYKGRIVEIAGAYQFGRPLSRPIIITYPPNYAGPRITQPTTDPNAPAPPAPPTAPTYTPSQKPSWWPQLQQDGFVIDRGTVWFLSHESYTAKRATPRYTYAAATSTLRSGADLAPGDVVNPNNNEIAVGTSASGGEWVISDDPYYTRFNLADLKP